MAGSPLSTEGALELSLKALDSYREEVQGRKTAMVKAIKMLQREDLVVDDVITVLLEGM